ncbi:MAG: hypothetical protein K2P78_04445 [Gemmataceae bacterium]|nr:hypothetical protein [Gemmataceae bacterium]
MATTAEMLAAESRMIDFAGDGRGRFRPPGDPDRPCSRDWFEDGQVVDHGWVIDRDFGHLTHGYVVTSHASQGVTVDKVFIGVAGDSFSATDQRAAYVAVTRGKEQAQLVTDDKEALLKAMSRPDEPLSATNLAESAGRATTPQKSRTTAQELAAVARQFHSRQSGRAGHAAPERDMSHER